MKRSGVDRASEARIQDQKDGEKMSKKLSSFEEE